MGATKIYLRQIIEQLNVALSCPEGVSVAAEVNTGDRAEIIQNWLFVQVSEDGRLTPKEERYATISDLIKRNPYGIQ